LGRCLFYKKKWEAWHWSLIFFSFICGEIIFKLGNWVYARDSRRGQRPTNPSTDVSAPQISEAALRFLKVLFGLISSQK
jgi:hypothetical protein